MNWHLPRATRAFWVVGVSLVVAVACTGESSEPETAGAPIVPTSLRVVAGPWPDEETDAAEYYGASLTSLGTDMVLATTSPDSLADDPDDRGAHLAVLDLDDDDWQTIDGPPDADGTGLYSTTVNEMALLETVTVDGEAYVLGARCREYNVGTEERPPCSPPGDVEMWRLTSDDLEWERLTATSFEELTGSPEWASITVLGVVDGRIWAQLATDRTTIVAFDPASGETEEIDRYRPIDHQGVSTRCVTGSGTIVGTALSRLATLQPGAGWVVHDHFEYESDHRMACANDTLVLFRGERWTEVDRDGAVVDEGPSPRTSQQSQWYPFTAGDEEVGFAADTPHSITVVPGLSAEPLTKDYPDDGGQVSLRGAARLPDGRITVLVDWPEHDGGDGDSVDNYRGRTQLLIAE